jgi:hypothetical protein
VSSSDQSTTLPDVMLSALDGLLTLAADPTAGARFAELTVARAKVLEAEQHLESDRAAFGAHEERVRSDLARLESDLEKFREQTEAKEGALVGRREHQAEVERLWAGIVFPNELPEKPLRPMAMTGREAGDARE